MLFRDSIPQDEANGLGDMPGRGTEFTCEDAKASFDFWGTPEMETERISTINATIFDHVTSTACPDGPDGYTFVITLDSPKAVTLPALTMAGLVMVDKDWLDWLVKSHRGRSGGKTGT